MGLIKLLFIGFLIYVLYNFISIISRVALFFNKAKNQTKPKYNAQTQTQENYMVKCAKCNLYIPQQDAITSKGQAFCSPEHAKN